ncbi:MAG: T9SS type A sorting domain-containing protein [Bacteroidetes bacterium]|nr:MAG: T9SS type A sorting domain-containing protein [Bacteroidota bacterium]
MVFQSLLLLCLLLVSAAGFGQNYKLLQSHVSAGGGNSSSASYVNIHSVGEYNAGSSESNHYSSAGVWEFYASQQLSLFSVSVAPSWNMLSLPVTVTDFRKTTLFPTAASSAFLYSGGYQQKDTLTNGTGYWVKFDAGEDITLTGFPRTKDSISVNNKWNMIGTISMPVPVSNILQVPSGIVTSSFFGYDDGYGEADVLEPGKAYWVKTNRNGKLVLNASLASKRQHNSVAANKSGDELNSILLEEPGAVAKAKRKQLKLVFGIQESSAETETGMFEMPPAPPAGSTDIRFASNQFGELIPKELKEPKEFPILIQTQNASLKLSWNITQKTNLKYSFLEKTGKKITAAIPLSGNSSAVLHPSEDKKYVLRVEPLPNVYALYQNYPNPFNPATVINYTLPVASRVLLKVYNLLGQEVATLVDEMQDAGFKSQNWDATGFASGMYYYRLQAGDFVETKKLLLVK